MQIICVNRTQINLPSMTWFCTLEMMKKDVPHFICAQACKTAPMTLPTPTSDSGLWCSVCKGQKKEGRLRRVVIGQQLQAPHSQGFCVSIPRVESHFHIHSTRPWPIPTFVRLKSVLDFQTIPTIQSQPQATTLELGIRRPVRSAGDSGHAFAYRRGPARHLLESRRSYLDHFHSAPSIVLDITKGCRRLLGGRKKALLLLPPTSPHFTRLSRNANSRAAPVSAQRLRLPVTRFSFAIHLANMPANLGLFPQVTGLPPQHPSRNSAPQTAPSRDTSEAFKDSQESSVSRRHSIFSILPLNRRLSSIFRPRPLSVVSETSTTAETSSTRPSSSSHQSTSPVPSPVPASKDCSLESPSHIPRILDPKYNSVLSPLHPTNSSNAGGKQDAKVNAPSPALSSTDARISSPQDTPTPAQYREAFHKTRVGRQTEMSRPTLATSRSSTLDSTTLAPSPDQFGPKDGLGGKFSSVNSSSTSLGKRVVQDSSSSSQDHDHPHAVPRSDPNSAHARTQSPPPPLPNQPASAANSSANSSSHLSGLVCNVHRTTGKEPHALVGATTTILGDKLYVFGGRRISRSRPALTSDLYELDLLRRHWTRLEAKGDIPSPRYFHSVCALGDSKLVCYGGMSPDVTTTQTPGGQGELPEGQVSVMSDVHIYNVSTQTWTKVHTPETPQGRYAHCAAILPSSAIFASANAPLSALHNNASGDQPNSGTIGVSIDGTGGAEMIIIGGQDSNNNYIEQISIFNLRSLKWTSTNPTTWRSCGAYRSVVTPLTSLKASEVGAGVGKAATADDGEDDNPSHSGSPMLVYTNYNFLDVKLELQIRLVDGTVVDKPMQTAVSPPGLRFPSGGILANHFVVSGTFLTSSKQEFALWALNLRTMTWAKIDVASSIFSSGSWNRGILWSRRNAFVILGNRKRNLVDDYNNRRLNFSNMCLVQLEAFGLYDNPRKMSPTSDYLSVSAPFEGQAMDHLYRGGAVLKQPAVNLGELAMDARELADMEILTMDGTRIPINSRVVARRWGSSFNMLMQDANPALAGIDTQTLRPSGGSIISRNSSVTITPSFDTGLSGGSTLAPHGGSSIGGDDSAITNLADAADVGNFPASTRPRIIFLPHTVPTINALLHFLYTSSLPPITSPLSTPQILCSLLQLARPYRVDGLLEAVVERLHESLDGRNAAAIFNAAAMGAGGGDGIDLAGTDQPAHPPRTASLVGMHLEALRLENGGDKANLRIDTDMANGMKRPNATRNGSVDGTTTESEDEVQPDSANSNASMASQMSGSRPQSRRQHDEVWNGGWSAVIGLQKRGLRGLMEGRRMRERGKGAEGAGGAEGSRVGLGIA
ncbi:hypothetical protein K461DRAFT_312708 [Myriangium duriaei CBS 260.36]|uniref:BTB domain-containing protein n=1 Tax=Myriangium duriaei CBS 260.36 TaxID=1168546 RepID=A0A9P4J0L8_9PEZI|nr:hypothetical protein K461DRAFT_312708 [Myriangium duriaei CBS 260.36]